MYKLADNGNLYKTGSNLEERVEDADKAENFRTAGTYVACTGFGMMIGSVAPALASGRHTPLLEETLLAGLGISLGGAALAGYGDHLKDKAEREEEKEG